MFFIVRLKKIMQDWQNNLWKIDFEINISIVYIAYPKTRWYKELDMKMILYLHLPFLPRKFRDPCVSTLTNTRKISFGNMLFMHPNSPYLPLPVISQRKCDPVSFPLFYYQNIFETPLFDLFFIFYFFFQPNSSLSLYISNSSLLFQNILPECIFKGIFFLW